MDGVHFLENPFVTLKVNNEAIQDETDFTQCNKENLIDITEKFVDAETGKEIAPADVNKAYSISMYNQLDIGPKKIEGYEYVSGPDMKGYKDLFIKDTEGKDKLGLDGKPGRDDEFVFKYKKVTNKPDTNPDDSDSSNNQGSGQPGQSQSGAGQNGSGSKQPVKTGDTSPVMAFGFAAVATGLAGAVAMYTKRRKRS